MALYYGTFACGCEGRVNVIGKMDQRDWKIKKAFEKRCESCYAEYLKVEREKQYLAASEEGKELGYPDLSGTEKQVKWGITLREDYIKRFKGKLLEEFDIKKYNRYEIELFGEDKRIILDSFELIKTNADLEKFLEYILSTKDDAKYYIDARSLDLYNIINRDYKNVFKTTNEIIQENEYKKKIKSGTVSPDVVYYSGVVNISFSKDSGRLSASYEKNDDFRNIVKDLNLSWCSSDGCWERVIKNFLYGTIEDRAAELGNRLLNEGFSICITDDNVRESAINADFEFECDNWILDDEKNANILRIIWPRRDRDQYSAARKITTSFYEEGVVKVKLSAFKEIRDFACVNDFRITPKAEKLLAEYENEYKDIKVVRPCMKKEVKEDKLEDILSSSREIINDLLDD